MLKSFTRILGIRFFTGDMEGLLDLTRNGGLVVAPSAPVLVDLPGDPAHREALEGSDIAITDSGFMVLLWLVLKGRRIPRISGLKYLRALIATSEFRSPGATFWVMPSQADAAANLAWLGRQGLQVSLADCYMAPTYSKGPLGDAELLSAVEARRPRFVVLCLGGGVQERLGLYLRRNLSAFRAQLREAANPEESAVRPALLCTGAAIAFLSERQANIPPWADRFMLGWLLRVLSDPAKYAPRYWKALRLVPLLFQNGERGTAPAG